MTTKNKILEMINENLLNKRDVVLMCLKWMSEDEVADMVKANELLEEDEEEIESETAEKDTKAEVLQLLDGIRNMVSGYADGASVDNSPTQEDLEALEAKLSELNRKLEAI